jgi:hypothetical protein
VDGAEALWDIANGAEVPWAIEAQQAGAEARSVGDEDGVGAAGLVGAGASGQSAPDLPQAATIILMGIQNTKLSIIRPRIMEAVMDMAAAIRKPFIPLTDR